MGLSTGGGIGAEGRGPPKLPFAVTGPAETMAPVWEVAMVCIE